MTGYVLGVDGGQTSTKAALASLDGRVLVQVKTGPWDVMVDPAGRQRCRAALASALDALLPAVPPGTACAAACLGLTGGRAGAALVEGWLRERIQPGHVEILSDPVTNLRGADPYGGAGVVVIAGGGSVAWGVTADGREMLAGAHGYLLDDEGSAYEIGRQAIIATLKAAHGRRPRTALTAAVLEHFGASDVWNVRMAMYDGRADRPVVSALLPRIVAVAEGGDAAALEILGRGIKALAEMAAAVIRALDFAGAPVYPTGGVFASAGWLVDRFRADLRQVSPLARVTMPLLPPLGGALAQALNRAGSLSARAVENLKATLQEGTNGVKRR